MSKPRRHTAPKFAGVQFHSLRDARVIVTGGAGGKSEARRVPKAAGGANLGIPEDFQKAFDAYNRGAGKKVK